MDAEIYNGYWISTDTYLSQAHREVNAQLIADYMFNLGWTRNAIAGMLGNMDVESSVNPALIEGRTYHTLIDNNTCLNVPNDKGVGLVQWTGDGDTPPIGQKIASFAIRNNMNWYDGNCQCFRIEREYDLDIQFLPGTVDGVTWNWQNYIISTESPETLAKVWWARYERGGTDLTTRQQKARYYYALIRKQIPLWLLYKMSKQRKVGKRPWRRM